MEYHGRDTASQTAGLQLANPVGRFVSTRSDVQAATFCGRHEQQSAPMPPKPGQLSLMMTVMPVNPDAMIISPSPMSRHPIPPIPTSPIPRPVVVVRAVADFNKDTRGRRRWRECAHAKESAQHD
jgi:hypothetical protein